MCFVILFLNVKYNILKWRAIDKFISFNRISLKIYLRQSLFYRIIFKYLLSYRIQSCNSKISIFFKNLILKVQQLEHYFQILNLTILKFYHLAVKLLFS